ncbi:MAG: hypothetical protein KDK70_22530, partial [Myxococcales bacterium]|nr:hypothetical protein [Myxococcales bacterium]
MKAWNPLMSPPPATEGTVKTPMPQPPATEGTVKTPMPQPPREQTVRARVPMPDLPWGGPLVEVTEGVPVSRSNAPTLPEAAAVQEPEPSLMRVEPPAVSGEMSVMDPEPIGMFDPRPPRPTTEPVLQAVRPTTEPVLQAVRPVRDDPPAVSGEVDITVSSDDEPVPPVPEISVMPMTASAPLPLLSPGSMTSSGHHPVMHPSCFPQRPGTDPGSYVGAIYT